MEQQLRKGADLLTDLLAMRMSHHLAHVAPSVLGRKSLGLWYLEGRCPAARLHKLLACVKAIWMQAYATHSFLAESRCFLWPIPDPFARVPPRA